jgi:hypothetical protein
MPANDSSAGLSILESDAPFMKAFSWRKKRLLARAAAQILLL